MEIVTFIRFFLQYSLLETTIVFISEIHVNHELFKSSFKLACVGLVVQLIIYFFVLWWFRFILESYINLYSLIPAIYLELLISRSVVVASQLVGGTVFWL